MSLPTALIAEDEPLLAASLRAALTRVWPQLQVLTTVTNGAAAREQALALLPKVLFLDIRMPVLSGLEVAESVAEEWPDATPLPLMVFVTAYDQYALQAFEQAAVDYVLKPVEEARLQVTCRRLQTTLQAREPKQSRQDNGALPEELLAALSALRGIEQPSSAAPVSRLRVIQASLGNTIHMVPVAEVLYFEAADKYIRVVTAEREYLVRIPLRQLLPQLDPEEFWQVHRGTVVRATAIASATRDDAGSVELTLRGTDVRLGVSRLYAHRFRAM